MTPREIRWVDPSLIEAHFDKQIHRDDFRLRLLMSNKCNLNCEHCLNDFQPKMTGHRSDLGRDDIEDALRAHSFICEKHGYDKKVAFSGGEPGLNEDLALAVELAHDLGYHTTMCTNGRAYCALYDARKYKAYNVVDSWHVSIHSPDTCGEALKALKATSSKAVATFVIKQNMAPSDLGGILQHLYHIGVPKVKLFCNFWADSHYVSEEFPSFVAEANEIAPWGIAVSSRHTGVQENRGSLCLGCSQRCITLKAAWVRPDGSVSPCARFNRRHMHPQDYQHMVQAMDVCEEMHRVE